MSLEQKPGWRDGYEFLREIGEGGAARVYAARRLIDGKAVAIKVLREELLSNDVERERMRREAVAITAIKSPSVCRIFDFNVMGEEAYIVMEHVDGVTLREVIKTHEWTPENLSVVVRQVAEALFIAHRAGIIHRDLKPENVMLAGDESARTVKVVDFGVAKLLEQEKQSEYREITRAGVCFGTPQYMSPEQTRGAALDHRSDLFALGVMAFELVAARRPFGGSDPSAVMLAVAAHPPGPITKPRAGLDDRCAELDEFFESALAKDPNDRPADGRALAIAFEYALGIQFDYPEDGLDDWSSENTISGMTTNVSGSPDSSDSEDEPEDLRSHWHRRLPLSATSPAEPSPSPVEEAVPLRAITQTDEISLGKTPAQASPVLWIVLGLVGGIALCLGALLVFGVL